MQIIKTVINIKKVLHFIAMIAKGLSFIILLFAISFLCLSIKLGNENVENPFCLSSLKDEKITLNYEEIIDYQYYFSCSTLYFIIDVEKDLSKEDIISLLILIGQDLKDYECFTHFEVKSESLAKTFYATIDLKTFEVSYV